MSYYKGKVHLLDTAEPISHWGIDLKANCGFVVAKAEAVVMFAGEMIEAFTFPHLRFCEKCVKTDGGKHYVYGIQTGEEKLQEAAE